MIKKKNIIIILLFLPLILLSCSSRPVDITIYVMLEAVRFVDYIIKQYNKTRKKSRIEYRIITPNHLEIVLTNKMQRENMFMLIAPYQISKRGKDRFFVQVAPAFSGDLGLDRLNVTAKKVVEETDAFCIPLYFYGFRQGNAQAACLNVVITGYNPKKLPKIVDLFHFLAQPEINAEALIFQGLPVYTNSGFKVLQESDRKRVAKTAFPADYITDDLLPKENLRLLP